MRYYRSWTVYVTYCTIYNRRTLHSGTNQHKMIEYLYGPTIYFPVNTYKNWQFSSGEHYRIISGYELYAAVIRVNKKCSFFVFPNIFSRLCESNQETLWVFSRTFKIDEIFWRKYVASLIQYNAIPIWRAPSLFSCVLFVISLLSSISTYTV